MALKQYRRYRNRKVYEVGSGKYGTLKDIYEAIKAGDEVTVIDHVTKEDITANTLLAAIVKYKGVTLQPLMELIR